MRFVIRLKMGNPPVRLVGGFGYRVPPEIHKGERRIDPIARYTRPLPAHVCG